MAVNEIQFLVKAKDEFTGVMSSVAKSAGLLGGAFAAAGTAAIAAGSAMFSLVKYTSGLQEEMRRLSRMTGESIETLSALAHTAAIGDVELGSLTSSLAFAQRAMGDASTGNEAMRKSFERAGVSYKDSSGALRESSDILADFADQLKNGADQAIIMSAGSQIFGRQFKEIIPMLKDGSEAMRAGAADAQFLGLVMSDQAAADADAFGDEMTRLGGAVRGVAMAVGNEWTPVMTGLVSEAADWVASMRETLADWAQPALVGMAKFYIFTSQVFTGLIAAFKRLFTAEGFNEFIEGGAKAFQILFETATNFVMNLGPMLIEIFKIIWVTFRELGEWAFQKLFDFFTGQDLADTLGDVLFKRIPEATEKYRGQFIAAGAKLATGVAEGAAQIGGMIGDALGIKFGDIDAEAQRWLDGLTKKGAAAKKIIIAPDTSAALEQAAKEMEEAYIKIGAVSTQYEEFYKAQLTREVEAFRQKGVDEETLAAYHHQKMMEMEMAAFTARLEMKTTQQEQDLAMEAAYQQSRFSLISSWADTSALKEAQARQQGVQFQKLTDAEKLKTTIKTGAETLSAVAGTNKTLFNLNKAFSLAQATAALPSAVVQSFQRAGGYPWGIIPAALMAAAGAAQISKIAGSSYGGAAHGGLDSVPKEQTYLLDRGERVLSPNQNRDLTNFMSGEGGGSVQIGTVNISVLENATNADALLTMSESSLQEIMARKFIPALDALSKRGIRQNDLMSMSR